MPRSAHGQHIATLTHEGRFWEVYLEIPDEAARAGSRRGRLVFHAGDAVGEEPLRTALIFVEPAPEQILQRARALNEHQLLALLRSCLP